MSRRTYVLMTLAIFLTAMTLISAAANASRNQEPSQTPTPVSAPAPGYTLERMAATQITETCELRAYALKAENSFPANLIVDRVFVMVCADTATIEKSK